MEIYVDELPKSCKDCEFCNKKYGICEINGSRVDYFGCHSLTPLSDYTKKVRKEAIQEVRKLLENRVPNGLYLSRAVLKKELDELQGE